MEDCCDNKNIIFTDYYVCTNCRVIQGYKYIHELTFYENENNLNKKFISKSFYKRIKYLSKKLYWITDRIIIIFLNEGLEEIKKHNNYNRIPFNKYVNSIYKYYCEKSNIEYNDLIKSKNNIKLDNNEIELLDIVYSKYCVQDRNVFK